MDHYRELGVDPQADVLAIKRAFRKIARRHHPDVSKSPNSTKRFMRARAAYEVLSDPVRRAEYDMASVRAEQERTSASRSFPPDVHVFDRFSGFGPSLFDEFFRDLDFPEDSACAFGDCAVLEVELTEREAREGCEALVDVRTEAVCGRCDGFGLRGLPLCGYCGGTGVRERTVKATLRVPRGVAHGDEISVPLAAKGLAPVMVTIIVLVL